MKKIAILIICCFFISSCNTSNIFGKKESDEFIIADKIEDIPIIPVWFNEFKNSAVKFIYPEWYKDWIEVKTYTFKEFIWNACIAKEIELWVKNNPDVVQWDIIKYWEERHNYYREVIHSIKDGFYEQSLNENWKHFDYEWCGRWIRLIGWKNVVVGWLNGVLFQYIDVKRKEPICDNNFTSELILVKSLNEIISIKLWENKGISSNLLKKDKKWNLCATFDDVESAKILLDKIMLYFSTWASLAWSPFAFLETRSEEINDILMSIKVDPDFLNAIWLQENKQYIERISNKYIKWTLEQPKEFSYDIPNITWKTTLEVETIFRAWELYYKVFYTGDNTYMNDHSNETITLKFKDGSDFMIAKEFITLNEFTAWVTRQWKKTSYLWKEWHIKLSQEKYVSVSGVSFTFPAIEQANLESSVISNLPWENELESRDFTEKNTQIIQKSWKDKMVVSSVDSSSNFKNWAVITWKVEDKNIDQISVDFSNKSSIYPDDHYKLKKFKKWDNFYEYKAFSEFDVFWTWKNTYTITGYTNNEVVAVIDVVIDSK